MKKFLKDNWFVLVVGVLFISIAIVFTIDQNKDNLPGKKVDGKEIVFSIDNKDYAADDVYNLLARVQKKSVVLYKFYTNVIDQAANYTEQQQKEIEEQANQVIAYYNQYGYTSDYLNSVAQYYYGYDTFYDYVIYSTKYSDVCAKYVKEHLSEVYTNEIKEKLQPRIVSYVVISMDDPKNPTAEELEKLHEAQDAWKSGEYTDFAEFAKKFSQDSNAGNGGKFGYIDTHSTESTDKVFVDTACALQAGQVSEWTYSETFGYYLIKCDSTDDKDLIEESGLVDSILHENEDLSKTIFWDTVQSLDITFSDTEVEEMIREAYDPSYSKKESEAK